MCKEVTCVGLVSHPGGVEILLVASYCRPEIGAGVMSLLLALFRLGANFTLPIYVMMN